MQSIRRGNIELLRVIAMLMVTMLHAMGHGRVLEQYEYASFGYILFWSFEALCNVAVNVFVLITGYFMVTSKFKPSRIVRLVIQTQFYSILCLLVSATIFNNPITLKSISYVLFPLTKCTYWFASAYVVLVLISPLLNKFINSMNKTQHLLSIILLSTVFCIIPNIMFWSRDILGNGYNYNWFIVLYLTAAYIRIYLSDESCLTNCNPARYFVMYLVLCGGGYIQPIAYWSGKQGNSW